MSEVVNADVSAPPVKPRAPRPVAWRLARGVAAAVCAVILVAMIGFGGLAWRLSRGPVLLDAFAPRITEALQQKLTGGFVIALSGAALEGRGARPSLTVLGLSIRDAAGREVISAPKAEVDFDPMRLFRPDAGLHRIALIGPRFKASITRQGEISLITGFSPPSGGGARPHAPRRSTANACAKRSQ